MFIRLERAWSLFFSLHIRHSSGLWSYCSWLHWLTQKVRKQLCKYKSDFQGPNPLVLRWKFFNKIMAKFSRSSPHYLFSQCCWGWWRLQIPHWFSLKAGWIQNQGKVMLLLHAQILQLFLLTPGILLKTIHIDDSQIFLQFLAKS